MEKKYIFWNTWRGFTVALLGASIIFIALTFLTQWLKDSTLPGVLGFVLFAIVFYLAARADRD